MAPRRERVGILPTEDRMAIIQGARKLGLDPYEFGAFLSLESGPNMDPNIVGGAGGRHKGLIQFGQNEQRTYGISGQQTRAGQMPAVLRYFEDRGFKPGMGIGRAYATVLGGNPNVSLTAKDSFGTSVQGVLPRFKPGGDLYKNAQRVLGDIPSDTGMQAPIPLSLPGGTATSPSRKGNILGSSILQKIMRENILPAMLKQGMQTNPYESANAFSLSSVMPAQDYLSDYISLFS
jgi:hypothetical protein